MEQRVQVIEAFQGEIISTPRVSAFNDEHMGEIDTKQARFSLCGGLQPRKKSGTVLFWKIPLLNRECPGQLTSQ